MVISRIPVNPISKVRGMGVADIERTSTWVRSRFNASLCSTPKRCSSSMITRPKSLNWVSGESSRWVPMTTSTSPVRMPSRMRSISASLWNRDSGRTVTGNEA